MPGLPRDAHGFIPADRHGAVAGLRDVYAVGDVTAFPVKQGSVAAHQADAAAAAISASLGAPVEPAPFEAIIDAVLLTGVTARYLHADLSETEPGTATVEFIRCGGRRRRSPRNTSRPTSPRRGRRCRPNEPLVDL